MPAKLTTKPKVFAVEFKHPVKGWIRLVSRYSSRNMARGWLKFIKAALGGSPLRIVEVKPCQPS
jgi:hypothetical protein